MKYRFTTNPFLYVLAISSSLIAAQEGLEIQRDPQDCWLQVGKLCVDQIKARHICAKRADLQCLCTSTARLKNISAETISANSACLREARILTALINNLTANTVCAQRVNSDAVCTTTVNATYVCVNGPVVSCSPYTGAALVDPTYSYTLGDPVIFQSTNALLDPNGDILQTGVGSQGTVYRAPRTGVYAYEIQLTSSLLQGPAVVGGQPTAQPIFYVNDVVRRDSTSPYLSFASKQTARLSGITRLNAGDHAHVKYFINVIDPVQGEIHYPGTVDLLTVAAPATIAGSGSFMIFYYLGDSPCAGCPCIPTTCTPVTIDCPTISVNCSPCNLDCLDCDPCAQ